MDNRVKAPYSAKRMFAIGEAKREPQLKERRRAQQEALNDLFQDLIIPRAKGGWSHAGLFWDSEDAVGSRLYELFSKEEIASVLAKKGFSTEFEYVAQIQAPGYYRLHIIWDQLNHDVLSAQVANDEYTNVQEYQDLKNEIEENQCAIKEYETRIAELDEKLYGPDTRVGITKKEKRAIREAKENGTSFVNFYEGVTHQRTAIKFGTQSSPEMYKGVPEEELMEAWLHPESAKVVD